MKAENKGVSNGELSRILSRMWKEAPSDVRKLYTETEAKGREQYKIRIAEWRRNEAGRKKLAKRKAGECGGENEEEENTLSRNIKEGTSQESIPFPIGVESNILKGSNAGENVDSSVNVSGLSQTSRLEANGALRGSGPLRLDSQQTVSASLNLNLEAYLQSTTSSLGVTGNLQTALRGNLLSAFQQHQRLAENPPRLFRPQGFPYAAFDHHVGGVTSQEALSVLGYGHQQMLSNPFIAQSGPLIGRAPLDMATALGLPLNTATSSLAGYDYLSLMQGQSLESILFQRALRAWPVQPSSIFSFPGHGSPTIPSGFLLTPDGIRNEETKTHRGGADRDKMEK